MLARDKILRLLWTCCLLAFSVVTPCLAVIRTVCKYSRQIRITDIIFALLHFSSETPYFYMYFEKANTLIQRNSYVFLAIRLSREILMFFLHCLIKLMFLELDVSNDQLILKGRPPEARLHLNLEHAQYEKCRLRAESPSSSRFFQEDRRRLCSQGIFPSLLSVEQNPQCILALRSLHTSIQSLKCEFCALRKKYSHLELA